jgi:hypothetical protein
MVLLVSVPPLKLATDLKGIREFSSVVSVQLPDCMLREHRMGMIQIRAQAPGGSLKSRSLCVLQLFDVICSVTLRGQQSAVSLGSFSQHCFTWGRKN